MPYLLDWTSHSLIRKRFLHSKGSLIRYLLLNQFQQDCWATSTSNLLSFSYRFFFVCFFNVMFRLPILAANHLPYFLMTSTTICALLTKRCSAHSHTLRFLSPTKSSSTLESQKPSSSVPQVPTFITDYFPTFKNLLLILHYYFVSPGTIFVQIQNTAEPFAIQTSHSHPTSIQ